MHEVEQRDEEQLMRASVGDKIIVRGNEMGTPDRTALVLAIEGPDGGPPYRVRWESDEHESVYVPGSDAIVEHLPVRSADQA
jgi:hypothetical protein